MVCGTPFDEEIAHRRDQTSAEASKFLFVVTYGPVCAGANKREYSRQSCFFLSGNEVRRS